MKRLLSLSASLMILLTLLSASMLSCGKRTRSAPDQVDATEGTMTKDELIDYLTQKNSRLEATHDAIYRLFGWISISLFIIAGTLLLLNLRENRRKDSKIYNSEQYIRHSIQAQEEERKRISLELHDSVAQDLRYVSLLAEGLEDKVAAQKILDTQNANIESIRRLCYNLTPPAIDSASLVPSLELLAHKIFDIGHGGTQFRIVCEPSVSFAGWSRERLMHLYRIVQEAMQNIQKHANAGELTVFFKKNGDHLKVIITDDGEGMDPALAKRINSETFGAVANMHFGLRNIVERTKLLGGKVAFSSEEGCGTMITVEV